MKMNRTLAALLCTVFFSSGHALAHHSGAQFDREVKKTAEVIVTRFDFKNPHAYIYAKSMDAEEADWEFELMDVANLFRQGWRKTSVVPGVRLKVVYNPLRREGSPGGWIISVTDPKGKILYNGLAAAGAAKY